MSWFEPFLLRICVWEVPNRCSCNPVRASFRRVQDTGRLQKSVGSVGINLLSATHIESFALSPPLSTIDLIWPSFHDCTLLPLHFTLYFVVYVWSVEWSNLITLLFSCLIGISKQHDLIVFTLFNVIIMELNNVYVLMY